MKTLRNTLIIVLAASCLGFVNLFAVMKSSKVKSAREIVAMDPKSEKIRKMSDQAIRDVLTGIVNNVTIEQGGKVNIIFRVNGNKQVEVLNVFGNDPSLVSVVKQAMTKTAIIVPEALEGKYIISVVF